MFGGRPALFGLCLLLVRFGFFAHRFRFPRLYRFPGCDRFHSQSSLLRGLQSAPGHLPFMFRPWRFVFFCLCLCLYRVLCSYLSLGAVLMHFFSVISTALSIVFTPLLTVMFTFFCLVDVSSIFVTVVYISFISSVTSISSFCSVVVSIFLLSALVFLVCSILLLLSVAVTAEAADIQLIPLPMLDVLLSFRIPKNTVFPDSCFLPMNSLTLLHHPQ